MTDASIRGRVVWHELMARDTTAASAFYTRVVGWTTQTWEHNPNYTMFVADGRPMGGLLGLLEAAAPAAWFTYVATPDIAESVKLAQTLGGTILKQPEAIPHVGRFAIIGDPQGAMLALITPERSPQPETPPSVGDFSWHELATTDWGAALEFYQRLFGWEAMDKMEDPAIGTYQMFGRDGHMLGGIFNRPAAMPGAPSWLPYVRVPDAKAAAARVAEAGGTVVNGPMEVPGGDWIAQGIDPQGTMFAVHSLKAAA
jgi:predicted enzyme related to lactoylglutathione lyase